MVFLPFLKYFSIDYSISINIIKTLPIDLGVGFTLIVSTMFLLIGIGDYPFSSLSLELHVDIYRIWKLAQVYQNNNPGFVVESTC